MAFESGGDRTNDLSTLSDVIRVIKDVTAALQQRSKVSRDSEHEIDIELSQGPIWNMGNESPLKPKNLDISLFDESFGIVDEVEADEAAFIEQHINALSNAFGTWSARISRLKSENVRLRAALKHGNQGICGDMEVDKRPSNNEEILKSLAYWRTQTTATRKKLNVIFLCLPYFSAASSDNSSVFVQSLQMTELEQVAHERDCLKIQYTISENAVRGLEAECQELKRQSVEKQEALLSLKNYYDVASLEIQKLSLERGKTVEAVEALVQDKIILEKKLEELFDISLKCDQLAVENVSLKESSALSATQHEQLKVEFKRMQKALELSASQQEELERVTASFVQVSFEKEEFARRLQKISIDLSQTIQEDDIKYRHLQESYDTLVSSLEEKDVQLKQALETAASLRYEVSLSKEALKQQDDSIIALNSKISEHCRIQSEVESRYSELCVNFDKVRNEFDSLSGELDDEKSNNKALLKLQEEHDAHLKQVLIDADATISILSEEKDKISKEFKNIIADLNEKLDQRHQLSISQEDAHQRAIFSLNQRISEYVECNHRLERQVLDLNEKYENAKLELQKNQCDDGRIIEELAAKLSEQEQNVSFIREQAERQSLSSSKEIARLQKLVETMKATEDTYMAENFENTKLIQSIECDLNEKTQVLNEFKKNFAALKYKDVTKSLEKALTENKVLSGKLESQSSLTVVTPSVSHNSAGKRIFVESSEKPVPMAKRRAKKNDKDEPFAASTISESPFIAAHLAPSPTVLSCVEIAPSSLGGSQNSTQDSGTEFAIRRSSRKFQSIFSKLQKWYSNFRCCYFFFRVSR